MPTKKNPVKYSKSTLKSAGAFSTNRDILQTGEITKEIRKEIQRVFHAANRRIQNIENSGVYSTAYEALKSTFDDRANLTKFAKFSLSGKTIEEIKIEYAKAVSFLQKPTSTSSGARQHEKYLQKQLGLNDWQFKAAKAKLMNKNLNGKQRDFAEKFLFRYSDVNTEFENAVNDVAAQIESDAAKVVNTLDSLENQLENINEIERDILESFSRFGM